MEARDGRNDDVEWDRPRCSVLLGRASSQVVSSRQLKHFSEFKAAVRNDSVIFFLVRVQILQECLCFRGWRILGHRSKDLTAYDSTDIDIMTKDGGICSGDRERNLGEGGVQGFNSNDAVLLILEVEGT